MLANHRHFNLSIDHPQKIVTYHKIAKENNLKKHFDLFEKKGILVTVDDGDPSFYHEMFPLIKKKNVPVILFIITGLIDTDIPFWWDEITYLLGKEEGEKKVWEVKDWSNKKRLDFLKDIRSNSKKAPLIQKQLTTEQLLEMQQAGVIIANHSHTHPMFDQCSVEELKSEFASSKQFFKERKLAGYDIFAYPNGNFSADSENILKEEGIKYGFLFDHKITKRISNPLQISRLSVNDKTSIEKLQFILSGWHTNLMPLRKLFK